MTNSNKQPASDKQADLHAALDDGSLIHAAAKGSMEKRQAVVERAELDEIFRGLKAMYVDVDAVSGEEQIHNFDTAKQAVLDWHNKQTLELLDRLQQRTVKGEIILGESAYIAITRAIEAERSKLKEAK